MAIKTSQGIPLIGPILNRIIGTRNDRFVKRYLQRVDAINGLETKTRQLTDGELKSKLIDFRARVEKGEPSIDLLPDAFAVAREAMDRAVGIRNIFNPRHEALFDASRLPAPARDLYEQTKSAAAALPPAPPDGPFQGCTEPQPGWLQVDIPVELYEAVRALYPRSRPPFRARPFDVQLVGGMVICGGKIAEMKTGEGKTIVGPLACYMAAIEGQKVHVVTVNDYLVQRDRDWTFPYFHALGMTVGAIHPMHMQPEQVKRRMYECDVVYGTTSEFGFDYLRDNMKGTAEQQVQKARQFAIVDEVDSILIDEARTPLIISGQAHMDAPRYELADRLARHLVEKQRPWQEADDRVQHCIRTIKGLEGDIRNARDKAKVPALQDQLKQAKAELPALERAAKQHTQYYEVQLERKQTHLTHDGIAEAQRVAAIGSFYVGGNTDVPHLLEQAVRALVVYQRDRDYIIMPTENPQTGRQEPSVVIVDVNTGRPMIGRQWSDGLHQAIETKEQVPIKQETQTVATITIQNFYKMYKRLAGMTGTADTEAQEFHDIYSLDVVAIPTNVTVVRRDFDDLMFLSAKDKWDFIVDEIKRFHDAGRPVLVGTTSVEKSETLSKMLTGKHAVKHEVLNAKQHERESHMIENAGQLGAVMIATNMAGRGTDIKLGPCSRQALLDHWLRRGIASRSLTTDATVEQLRENVYRKIAPQELDIPKREADEAPFADLELRLLRAWALKHTWLSDSTINKAPAEELRAELDRHGRFILHRLDWFDSVEALGGLHVIGTERHESRRIDNQLRGRSGRQGDNGSSRFFVSLEDDLMKLFAGETTQKVLARLGMREGDAIEHPMLSKSVERAQRKVEERNFQGRKTILEYDEVMEHQRQTFYGLRQRVIDGRDVRGLIFEYIEQATDAAINEYVDPGYAARCAADFARERLDVPITADRLRGLDINEMDKRIRDEAKEEMRARIAVTLGEYMPPAGSEVEVDFDADGLARWAKTQFGVDIDADEVRARGRDDRRWVEDMLIEAAERRVDQADLDGIAKFADAGCGPLDLAHWAQQKFGFTVDPDQIIRQRAEDPEQLKQLFLTKAREAYIKREFEYPVDFAMDMTMMLIRQNPSAAAQQLVTWANNRFDLGWTPEFLMKTPPQQAKEQLLAASRAFVEEGRLAKAIDAALACPDDAALETYFKDTLKSPLPASVKRLKGEERLNAVRARVESVLRAELLYLERTMLLEALDDSWKSHLYSMDQLRDSINYRAFSQQDPRIEYKREGSRIFLAMMESIRDRVTDAVFKLKLTPQSPPTGGPAMRPPPAAPRPGAIAGGPTGASPYYMPPSSPPAASGGSNGTRPAAQPAQPRPLAVGTIAGPGIDLAPSATPPTTHTPPQSAITAAAAQAGPMSDRARRDLEAAQQAGSGGAGEPSAKTPIKADKRVGRNDPCPCGSGRKYKKCCGNDGADD